MAHSVENVAICDL